MIFYILYVIISKSNSQIKFPFKKQELRISEFYSFYNYLTYNLIYIKLNVGNPKQEITVYLSLDKHVFYISGIKGKGTFNEKSSNTFKLKSNESKYLGEGIENGIKAEDTIYLNDKIIVKNFPFILANEVSIESNYTLNVIGLKYKLYYSYLKEENFLHYLIKEKIISSSVFTIKYLNEKEGEFIIGGYPHEYDNQYKENNFKFTKAKVQGDYFSWEIEFDKILYDNIELQEMKLSIFTINFNGFIVTEDFQKILNESFFNQYFNNQKCIYERKNNIQYSSYICDNDIEIKKFKTISFYHKPLNMSFYFEYFDLFKLIDNKYYFLVLFTSNKNAFWTLGEPFLKKYQMVFAQDDKIFGFYKENNLNYEFIPFIIVFLLLFILIFLLLFFKKILFFKKRKSRINEIQENIEYNVF